MKIKAEIVADSVSTAGSRITTFQLTYPRVIHGEVMTHRVFSRNAMSSRAIPVMKLIREVWDDPFVPMYWGSNKPGMQAGAEVQGWKRAAGIFTWRAASKAACLFAYGLTKLGFHKQIGNRLLEPFQWMRTVLTATEFDNFFELRMHKDAEPHFQTLAQAMWDARLQSRPRMLEVGVWHLPYIEPAAYGSFGHLCKVSAARCARVSYLTHDGKHPSVDMDLKLYGQLAGGSPMHASPLEHQAMAHADKDHRSGNLVGWVQFRKQVEEQRENHELL